MKVKVYTVVEDEQIEQGYMDNWQTTLIAVKGTLEEAKVAARLYREGYNSVLDWQDKTGELAFVRLFAQEGCRQYWIREHEVEVP